MPQLTPPVAGEDTEHRALPSLLAGLDDSSTASYKTVYILTTDAAVTLAGIQPNGSKVY